MAALGGGLFLMSEVPPYRDATLRMTKTTPGGAIERLQEQGASAVSSVPPRPLRLMAPRINSVSGGSLRSLIRTSICDGYSGAIKITTHLDHNNRCKIVSGTNWSNR